MTVVQESVSSFSFTSASLHAGPLPWEAHMLRSIQASTHVRKGEHAEVTARDNVIPQRCRDPGEERFPAGAARCVWAWAELRRGRQISAGWMQKDFSVAASWQAVRQSSLANYNISSISTVGMTQTLKSISELQPWFRFTVPISFLLLLLIICSN